MKLDKLTSIRLWNSRRRTCMSVFYSRLYQFFCPFLQCICTSFVNDFVISTVKGSGLVLYECFKRCSTFIIIINTFTIRRNRNIKRKKYHICIYRYIWTAIAAILCMNWCRTRNMNLCGYVDMFIFIICGIPIWAKPPM